MKRKENLISILVLVMIFCANNLFAQGTAIFTDLTITKTVNNLSPFVGSTVVFTITVTNVHYQPPGAASYVTDVLPSGYTFLNAVATVGAYDSATGNWNIGNLIGGKSEALVISATVNATGDYTNTATATPTSRPDLNPANNTSSVTITPQAIVPISVIGSCNSPTVNLMVEIIYNNLPVGSTVTWHTGNPATASNQVPNPTAVGAGTYYMSYYKPATGCYSPVSNAVIVTIDPCTDLSINKLVSNLTPNLGSNITFTVTTKNNGPDNATGVSVADLLPIGYTYLNNTASVGSYSNGTGVWTIGNLANGATAILSITATVLATGNYVNTAAVTSATTDIVLTNNMASSTIIPIDPCSLVPTPIIIKN